MKLTTLIIDDFLDDPDKIRNFLINNKVAFDVEGNFPGKRSTVVDNTSYQDMIIEKIQKILSLKIKMKLDSFRFHLCLLGDETWAHIDPTDWTGVLYLTPNAPSESGTLFLEPDDQIMERVRNSEPCRTECNVESAIGNVYNRMVLFRGSEIPHMGLVGGFGDCVENGRLTQVFYFDEV